MANETELVISGDGMPPTAVRGITESLVVPTPLFDKYQLTLACNDKNSPAFDALRVGIWRRTVNGGAFDVSGNGSVVSVDAISEWAYKVGSPAAGPQRTPVTGSERQADGYVFYRPHFSAMGVADKSMQTDEYGAFVSWELVLLEI